MAHASDARKLFLQAVLSRRFMPTPLAQALWQKSRETVMAVDESVNVPNTSWDDLVTEINVSLNNLDLEFSRVHDEETGAEMWALVNRRDDDVAQVASDLSPPEIAYFKALVEEIVLAPNNAYSISSLAAMREPVKPASMTKAAAETVLSSFVARGWLLKSRKGRFSLSSRSLLELQAYLKTTYADDLLECTICLELLTKGVGCPTHACKVWVHEHCYEKYKKRSSKCPSCQSDWAGAPDSLVPAGENAARAGDDAHTQTRARRRGTSEAQDEEEEEAEFIEGEDEDEPAQTQPKTNGKRKSSRRAASTPSQADALDEDEDEEQDVKPNRRKSGRRRG
ncbi:hypothetical protein PENSPDRAFT_382524 [Peniophora sp. CONT]|nr:hypothetical protein PENSPDRAFT_382524 [Peniophora sp. CONT]